MHGPALKTDLVGRADATGLRAATRHSVTDAGVLCSGLSRAWTQVVLQLCADQLSLGQWLVLQSALRARLLLRHARIPVSRFNAIDWRSRTFAAPAERSGANRAWRAGNRV